MRQRIYDVAVELIAEKGFDGTSVRDLAQAVGIEAASLYHHFPSKQNLLLTLFDQFMDAMLDMIAARSMDADAPAQRLDSVVHGHVLLHVARAKEALISHSELRSLSQEGRKQVVAKRDRYELAMRELLEAGVRAGEFEIADVRLTTKAILMMCSGVSDWYDPGGRLAPEAVAAHYVELVRRLVARAPAPLSQAPAARPKASAAPARAISSLASGRRQRSSCRPTVGDINHTLNRAA
jgi:AcrR family transcriptional regulator